MNSAGRQIEPRPPSRPKLQENDLHKAFSSLEEEILNLQSYIDRSRVKCLDSGVYRGKLISRRSMNNSTRPRPANISENSQSLQQYRNTTLTEPIYNLIIATLGPHYSSIPTDTMLRLSLLKIKLHEIFLKKISELIAIKLGESDLDYEGKFIIIFHRLFESIVDSKDATIDDDTTTKILENDIQQLKLELKREASTRKENEELLSSYILLEKQRNEEIERLNKKLKENEDSKSKAASLIIELDKLKRRSQENESYQAKNDLLLKEISTLNDHINTSKEIYEKSARDGKRLKDVYEALTLKEKLNIKMIENLNFEIEQIKAMNDTKFENDIQRLKLELTKEGNARKESEELLSRHILLEKQKSEEIDKLKKQLTENEDRQSKIDSLITELDNLKRKSEESDSNEAKVLLLEKENADNKRKISLLMIELDNLKRKTEENEAYEAKHYLLQKEISMLNDNIYKNIEVNEKLARDATKLKNTIETLTLREKQNINIIESLNSEIEQIKAKNDNKFDEKCIYSERLLSENKYYKADLQKCRETIECLQNKILKMNQEFDEDTFENVMRNELAMMRETYEKRLKEARDEIDTLKRKHSIEVKKFKDEIKLCEHSKEYLEIKLKAIEKAQTSEN